MKKINVLVFLSSLSITTVALASNIKDVDQETKNTQTQIAEESRSKEKITVKLKKAESKKNPKINFKYLNKGLEQL